METYLFALPMTVDWGGVFISTLVQMTFGSMLIFIGDSTNLYHPKKNKILISIGCVLLSLASLQCFCGLLHIWGVF